MTIYTAGYEGLSIDTFIKELQNNQIDTVIDVRELPLSRKPGFSKKALESNLIREGIDYFHIRELGTPRELRRQLHDNELDYANFFRQYEDYVNVNEDEISDAVRIAEQGNSVLLCFEKMSSQCHRSVLANILVENSRVINDIVNL